MPHPVDLPIEELLLQCDLKSTRGSGPGGQHRNKTESAVVLTHRASGIMGQASERRSQHENRSVAVERLRINLALAVRCPRPMEQVPSALWESRRQGTKIEVSQEHQDYAVLLAEVLDVLEFDRFDVAASAQRLRISSTQLIKFLRRCPPAFEKLNQARIQLGLRRLK